MKNSKEDQDRVQHAVSESKKLMMNGFRYLVFDPQPQKYPDHIEYLPVTTKFDSNGRKFIPIDSPEGLEILGKYRHSHTNYSYDQVLLAEDERDQ